MKWVAFELKRSDLKVGSQACRIFLHDCILARSTSALVPRNIARDS